MSTGRPVPKARILAPTLLLMIGLALRLPLAWQDHHILMSEWLWSDDAFLSLSVARNLALGHGMTSDGTHVTNGFQPLYVALMVPVYLLVPRDNLVLPIHLAATMLAVAGTAAAGVFYLIALRLFSRTAALCVLFFFMVSHYFVATDINGLETALYGLMLSVTLYYYLTRFVLRDAGSYQLSAISYQPDESDVERPKSKVILSAGSTPLPVAPSVKGLRESSPSAIRNPQSAITPLGPSRRQCAILGVLAGLTVLARVDAVVFVSCVALHFLWKRHRTLSPALKQAAVGAAACFITLAPWLAANLLLCKRIVPDSGPAVRFLAIQNGWKPVTNLIGYPGPQRFTEDTIPWQYYANNVLHLTAQIIAFLPLTAHAQGLPDDASLPRMLLHMPIGRLFTQAPWLFLSLITLIVVFVLVGPLAYRGGTEDAGLRTMGMGRAARPPGLRPVLFLRFAVVAWVAAYGFYLLCPWYSHRYLYPVLALLTLASGGAAHVFLAAIPPRHRILRRSVLGLAAAMYAFVFVTQAGHYYTAHRSPGLPDRYTPVVPWIKEHVPRDATIGSFQSGVLSYFLPNRCVNLDGVVNPAALRAMRERRLWSYIRDQKVDYIVDWPVCIDGLLTMFAGVDRLPLVTLYDEYSMHVYKVVDAP